MNKFLKTILDKTNKTYKLEFERQKKFFQKPDVLISLGIMSLKLLDTLVKEQKTEKEISAFIRSDNTSKAIISYTSNDFDEDSLSELLLECFSETELKFPELSGKMSAEDYLNFVNEANDIDRKMNSAKLSNLLNKMSKNSDMLLSYTFLLQHIVQMTISLLTSSEYPSPYRTKYIQKLLRNAYGLMGAQLEELKAQGKTKTLALKENVKKATGDVQDAITNKYEKIRAALKQIDNILIAVTLASSVYLLNRIKLQRRSRETLRELTSGLACTSFPDPSDVSVAKTALVIDLDCPISKDDELVPHAPIEEKLKALSCEVTQNEEIVTESALKPDLATMAIIRNERKNDVLTVQVSEDAYVTQETQIGKIGDQQVFAPTLGRIDKIGKSEVVIRDIRDPDSDYLATQINLLSEKYEKLNNTKAFLKYYEVESLYPVMLAISTTDDASINATKNVDTKIETKWEKLKTSYERIDKEYEKQVKRITGIDNVEMHAKDETLNEIEKEMNEQQDIFYKHLKMIDEQAKNISKTTKANSSEYELFEYYALNIGPMFNGIENPNNLEITFRDMINEYIRKRLILDEYKKGKIENKLNDLIKDIEKGISVGNWFKKAWEVYSQKKKVSDVKKWLAGLANKNKKLEGNDKLIAVNRVVFLFELYLDYDKYTQKYTILKKETTKQAETVKEGNWIYKFLKDRWIEYKTLSKEIEEIQKIIDSLALFQTFSIIEYEGKQARLYTLADKPDCEPNDENYKPSSVGYGDIRYWLKYCSYATLASVTNPATGWSTGWIIPTPILLPVIYIPIKSITTRYGFITMGISICGIWIFPWVLLANLSSNNVIPFGDPTGSLKQEIADLKKDLSDQLTKLKKEAIKKMMSKTKQEIEKKEEEINSIKDSIKENKDAKPSKYEANGAKKPNKVFLPEFAVWSKEIVTLQEQLVKAKEEQWVLTKKWKIMNEAYKTGKSLKGSTEALEKTEELINKQFDKLNALTDKLDKVIAPLPITMKPNTANFGITLKNTKPIIKIANELDNNINEGPLNKIVKKFYLKNDNMMSSNYGSDLSGTIINSKAYKSALSTANFTIIQKDPFPKYEKLSPINVPWITFLYKDFVKVGAQTYGFPGQLPTPIG